MTKSTVVDLDPTGNQVLFKAESGDEIIRLAASFVLPIPLISSNLCSIWPDRKSKTNVGMV